MTETLSGTLVGSREVSLKLDDGRDISISAPGFVDRLFGVVPAWGGGPDIFFEEKATLTGTVDWSLCEMTEVESAIFVQDDGREYRV